MRQQCVLTPKKANDMLCWISRSTAIRMRDLVLPLYTLLGCGEWKPMKGQWRWMGTAAHDLGGEAE